MSEVQPDTLSDHSGEDFRDLFENAPCGYLSMTAEGRITRCNATFAHWIETDAGSLLGKPFRDLLTVPVRIFYETNFAPMLRLHGAFEEVALDLMLDNGGKLPVLANASTRRGADGVSTSVRLILVRAKDRRSYERDLRDREATAIRQLADEKSISSLREQFIAVLGHDLRNPLASVSSGVRLLQRNPTKERAERIAGMMHASVLRMTGMIDNLLDFARGRLGGGISLQRRPADLRNALQHVVNELRAADPGREVEERYDLPKLVDCDVPRMSQLVSNLVGNAFSHGDPATFVSVDAFVAEQILEISVANGGDPIPEHKMQALFQPFKHDLGSAPQQGLGLGLFIASEIARSHGATLTADSSIHETRFTLRMPLAPA